MTTNPRIMVTLTGPLQSFLDYEEQLTGRGHAETIRSVLLDSREYADFRKDQARIAAEAVKASTKTTVVVEARPTREDMLAEERERQRRIREQEAHPPWPVPPLAAVDPWKQENKETFCEHGELATDAAGYKQFCFDCAVEEGIEVCHEHRESKPCMSCAYEAENEAAP